MTLRSVKADEQLAFDEQIIKDADVEAALEARQAAKEAVSAARLPYEEADQKARSEIAKLELPEGGTARVGRFRIAAKRSDSRHVEFDTESRVRITIGLVPDE